MILKKISLIITIIIVISVIGLFGLKNYFSVLKLQHNFIENNFNVNEYNNSFSKVEKLEKQDVLAIITSHHFLAKDLISQTLAGINNKEIKMIILVSPDHFNQINDLNCLVQSTINTSWKTQFGIVDSDQKFIDKIFQKKELCFNLNTFKGEHGINVLVPFIRNYFPQVKIVPLVLKQTKQLNYFVNFGEELSKMVNQKETLLIISSDFSHYVTKEEAKKNDQKSIELLPNKKIEEIDLISNDCKQCTALLFGYLKNQNTNFKLISNKNSFDISGQNPINVTSYVQAYYK